jgi:hypothetical protein
MATINNTDVHKNTFDGGMNSDVNIDATQPNQYRDALNVDIASDGEFFAAKNIKGTTEVQQLFINTDAATPLGLDREYNLLGVWSAYGHDANNIQYPTLVIADIFNDGSFVWKLRISTYNIQSDNLSILFTKTIADNTTTKPLTTAADAVIYSEAGSETIYITDAYSGLYRVPVLVNTAATYSDEDVSMLRTMPLVASTATHPQPLSGGSLLSGSYQFAIRFRNKALNKHTKWSALTRPISVSNDVNVITHLKNSAIGSSTERKIMNRWAYDTTQAAEYDYAEILVVENIDGTATHNTVGKIVGPVTISSLVVGGYLEYHHKSNSGVSYDLAEALVDTAAIKTADTLAVKDNRLLLGGITYHDLSYATKPSVNTGNTQLIYHDELLTSGTPSDLNGSLYKGYFRGEVYRFAVTFHDAHGNWSAPEVLDFSGVSENYAGGGIDFGFPRRDYGSGSWQTRGFLFNTSTEHVRQMGLQIGIDNIPSWAKGMQILRAPRIKKIISQTPVIPSILVQPAEITTGTGLDTYPTSYHTGVTERFPDATNEDTTAQPPAPLGTLVPKNFGHSVAKSIIRDQLNQNARVPNTACQYSGASLLPSESDGSLDHYQTVHVQFLYPPDLLYTDGTTKWSSLDAKQKYRLDVIDGALLDMERQNETFVPLGESGNNVESNAHLTFYAKDKDQYYFYNTQTTALESESAYDLLEIKHIPYNTTSTLLTEPRKTSNAAVTAGVNHPTSTVMNYPSLMGTGHTGDDDGYIPNAQEAFVAVTALAMNDIAKTSFTGSAGGGAVNGDTAWLGTKISTTLFDRHKNYWADTGTSRSAIRIANIVSTVDDNRYGDKNQYHPFQSTGNYKDVDGLTSTTIDVWGGDCYIGFHTFKITDRCYSIPNSQYADGTTSSETDNVIRGLWGRQYDITSAADTGGVPRPVATRGCSQTISIVMESEINPNSIDYNNDTTGYTQTTFPFSKPSTYSGVDVAIPNNYRCNLSSNLDNKLKVWTPIDDADRELTETKSRIAYSDQKVYNADIEGFDRFPALNYYDLDESYGGITKLLNSGDRVYCIQEAAYSYVPINANVIQTADATNLSVRSGEVIGQPQYINTKNGSQHPKTVQEVSGGFYFFDFKNKVLVKTTGGQEIIVSDNGLIDKINDIGFPGQPMFGHEASELLGIHDSKNRKYILAKRKYVNLSTSDEFAYVYDERLGAWTGRWCMEGSTSASILGGVTSRHGDLMLIGTEEGTTNPVQISSMYTGSIGTFFGVAQPAYLRYVVNPVPDLAKTFDSIIVNSNAELTSLGIIVPLNDSALYSTAITDFDDIESLYKAKTLRNTIPIGGKTGQRMRGRYAYCLITFDQTKDTKLNSILTRYRPSNRGI